MKNNYNNLSQITKGIIIISTLFFISFHLNSQNEFNNWYFGINCGVSFNTTPPTAMTNGAVNISDQTSTYSDSLGNLKMYSDGRTVYNKNHVAMPNGSGLLGPGNPHSHASIILRKPGSANLYYLFTLTYFGYSQGLRYAIIDMNLQGGLGDVISKNNQLITPVCEKLAAVRHQNGTDIWIITHEWDTDAFYAYLLTNSGINSPVITNIGPVHTGGSGPNYNAAGQLVASCDGTKIAIGTYDMNFIGIYNFNKSTGIVSNQIQIPGYQRSWGVAFSPDGTKLYATKWTYPQVYQFDITSGNATTIANSSIVVGNATTPNAGYKAGFLQLGPDGKIYVAKMDAGYIACINNPNVSGTSCNFVDNAVYLSGKTCQAGLPIFEATRLIQPNFSFQNICASSTVNFTFQGFAGFTSCLWNFGDPTSGMNNSSTLLNPSHFYLNSGTYTATLYLTYSSYIDTIQHTVIVYPLPLVNLGQDTSICQGNSITLNAGNPGASYLWYPGNATTQTSNVNSSGQYIVQVTNANTCVKKDTINITVYPTPLVNLGNDTAFCQGNQMTLNAGNPGASYLWTPGGTINQTLTVSSGGQYMVQVTNSFNCSKKDSINITVNPTPLFNLGHDTAFCQGNQLTLVAWNPGASYLWNPGGATTPTITVNASGQYSVLVSNAFNCTRRDTINITVNPAPVVNLGNDTTLCQGSQLILNAGNPGAVYLWSNTSNNQTILVSSSGNYWVEVTNSFLCKDRDSILVNVIPIANADITPINPVCKNASPLNLTAVDPGGIWSGQGITGSFTGTFNPAVADTGTHLIIYTISNLCGDSDSVYIKVLPSPSAYADTVRPSCPDFLNGSIILQTNGGTPPYTYLWNGNHTGDTLTNLSNGIYTVTISDENNCKQSVSVLFDVTIIDCIPTVIYVPNIFSPNGDGANDIVYVHGQMVKELEFVIYDRWGEKIFETTDITQGWDGTFRGKNMMEGVYAYYLKATGANDLKVTKKGNITLVR